MMRWLQLLLVGVAIATAAGCATFNDPGHLSVQTEATTPTAVAPDAVAPQAAAPGQSVTMYDVEPMQEDVVAAILEGFRTDPWQPYLNSRAPPDQIAQFSRFSRSPLLNPPSCLPQPRPARPPFNLGPVQPSGSFCNALQISLVPQFSIGSGVPSFTRATTATQEDFSGKLNAVLSDEPRFQGDARYYNEYVGSASLATQGNTVIAGTYAVSFTGTGTITFSGANVGSLVGQGAAITVGAIITTTAGTLTSTVSGTVTNAMLENKTGATNQNPAPFYVDSATAYGSNVNAVKYDDHLNASTISSGVLTRATGAAINSSNAKFAVLPGVVGSYFSTPDSATNSITGDIDIRFIGKFDPTVAQVLVAKRKSAAAGDASYVFTVATVGMGKLGWIDNAASGGVAEYTATATLASVGILANTQIAVRVTRVSASGVITFYYSLDGGVTWTQLGNTVAGTAGALVDSTSSVEVGAQFAGTTTPITGNIYRAQIYNGINGTLAVDFNPNLSTSAQTFTAATGEVWTTNGTARIFGNTNATYGIPAQWDSGGPKGYFAEGQRQNTLFPSVVDVSANWAGSNRTVTANAVVAPDGTTTGASVLETAVNNNHTLQHLSQAGVNGTTYTASALYKDAGRRYTTFGMTDEFTGGVYAYFDLQSGVISQAVVNGGSWTAGVASIVPYPNGWYRLIVTGTLGANSVATVYGYLSNAATGTETPSYLGDITKGMYVWGAMREAASFASSYIPTTTVAVTRNASVDQYVSASNVPTNNFTIYGEVVWPIVPTAASYYLWSSYVDANNSTSVLWDGTNLIARKRIAGVNTDATKALTPTANTRIKWAARFSSTSGIDIFHTGAIGTNNPTTTAAQIGTNFQIGADGNGANQPFATVSSFRIYPVALSSGNLTTMTTDAVNWLLPENWAVAANDDYFRKVANQ